MIRYATIEFMWILGSTEVIRIQNLFQVQRKMGCSPAVVLSLQECHPASETAAMCYHK